jgi:hypothetical protein
MKRPRDAALLTRLLARAVASPTPARNKPPPATMTTRPRALWTTILASIASLLSCVSQQFAPWARCTVR